MAVDNHAIRQAAYAKVKEFRDQPGFPAGLQVACDRLGGGSADMLQSMKESIDNTELTTIVLVVVILLIVYRAPGLVLVPLASIAVSYFVSLNLIALVAQWAERHPDVLATIGRWLHRPQFDFQVFKTTQIFIIVILFGAATDYCLFLIVRYREELDRGLDAREALEEAAQSNRPCPDRQRHDHDPRPGGDDLRRLWQVPLRRADDRHVAGRGLGRLHDGGAGLAAGDGPRRLLALRRGNEERPKC